MPLLRQSIILRKDLRANPQIYYIFGDNEERYGLGGQAREMRGEPNAIGIATLRAPGKFWQETESAVRWQNRVLDQDFSTPLLLLRAGKVVVLPFDGIGTGLAALQSNSPSTWAYLQALLLRLQETS